MKRLICLLLCLFLCVATLSGTAQTKAVLLEGTAIAVTLKLLAMAGITIGGVYSLVELAKTTNELVKQIAASDTTIYDTIDYLTGIWDVQGGFIPAGSTARLLIIDITKKIQDFFKENPEVSIPTGNIEITDANGMKVPVYDEGTMTSTSLSSLNSSNYGIDSSKMPLLSTYGNLNVSLNTYNGKVYIKSEYDTTYIRLYRYNNGGNYIGKYVLSTTSGTESAINQEKLVKYGFIMVKYNNETYLLLAKQASTGKYWPITYSGSITDASIYNTKSVYKITGTGEEQHQEVGVILDTSIPYERLKKGWEAIPETDTVNIDVPAYQDGYAQPEGALKDSLPQVIVDAIPREGVDIDTSGDIISIPVDITKDAVLDFTGLKNSWAGITNVFPFCLPFDFLTMVQSLVTTPETPVFSVDFAKGPFIGGTLVELDLSEWNGTAQLVRTLVFICFCGFLLFATSKIMRW